MSGDWNSQFVHQGELDFIRTKWDMIVDEESLNPGKQIFEKERVKHFSDNAMLRDCNYIEEIF